MRSVKMWLMVLWWVQRRGLCRDVVDTEVQICGSVMNTVMGPVGMWWIWRWGDERDGAWSSISINDTEMGLMELWWIQKWDLAIGMW